MSRYWLEEFTPERLGAREMTSDELRELAEHLRLVAGWLEEVRVLQLEHERNWRERIPNRPTIGFYLRLQKESA